MNNGRVNQLVLKNPEYGVPGTNKGDNNFGLFAITAEALVIGSFALASFIR